MRTLNFRPSGACCTLIEVQLDGDIIHQVRFASGCHGNHQAIQSLVRGRTATEVIAQLEGISCRNGTSCPDQLAKALRAATTQPAE